MVKTVISLVCAYKVSAREIFAAIKNLKSLCRFHKKEVV